MLEADRTLPFLAFCIDPIEVFSLKALYMFAFVTSSRHFKSTQREWTSHIDVLKVEKFVRSDHILESFITFEERLDEVESHILVQFIDVDEFSQVYSTNIGSIIIELSEFNEVGAILYEARDIKDFFLSSDSFLADALQSQWVRFRILRWDHKLSSMLVIETEVTSSRPLDMKVLCRSFFFRDKLVYLDASSFDKKHFILEQEVPFEF